MSVAGLGHVARIRYLHDGERREAEVEMIAAPETPPRDAVTLDDRAVLPGLSLARMNPAVATELDLPMAAEGVVVTDPGPYAARIGLRRGDIVLKIDGRAVTDPDRVDRLLRRAAPRVEIEALRGNRRAILRFRT